MTLAKAGVASEQCPVGIKWLKTAIMDEPTCAAQPPTMGDNYDERAAWDADRDRMTFKSRGPIPPSMQHLLGDDLEQALLKADYGHNGQPQNVIKCVLPLNHISKCVQRQFQGQSWMRMNEDDIKRDFVSLGLPIKSAKLVGQASRQSQEGTVRLPVHRGLHLPAKEERMDDRGGERARSG